ncbi:MAG: ABC transporter ATP-binding protein [Bacteriovoracales bacterium]|nr:ABC transporter ATP-binding protein [Bacteriovoracales bacterium]
MDGLSFTLGEGEAVGLLGANGSGKTTSLRVIMGFTKADRGEVLFDSKLGPMGRDFRQNVGFLPERPYFYPDLTGRDFLCFMGALNGMSRKGIRKSIIEWSERFKIDFALDSKIKIYSKGMLQRIGLCSALLHNPKLLILDEPLSGLDPIGRKELKDAIREVNRQGKTVFFSTHIIQDVEEICEKVIFIEKGKLLYEGAIDKLMTSGESFYEFKISKRSVGKNFEWNGNTLELEDFLIITVSGEDRLAFLKKLIDKEIDIESIVPIRSSLEEIFYKVKNREGRICL